MPEVNFKIAREHTACKNFSRIALILISQAGPLVASYRHTLSPAITIIWRVRHAPSHYPALAFSHEGINIIRLHH